MFYYLIILKTKIKILIMLNIKKPKAITNIIIIL